MGDGRYVGYATVRDSIDSGYDSNMTMLCYASMLSENQLNSTPNKSPSSIHVASTSLLKIKVENVTSESSLASQPHVAEPPRNEPMR